MKTKDGVLKTEGSKEGRDLLMQKSFRGQYSSRRANQMTVGRDEVWKKVRMCKSERGSLFHKFSLVKAEIEKRIKQTKPQTEAPRILSSLMLFSSDQDPLTCPCSGLKNFSGSLRSKILFSGVYIVSSDS